jgi:hypothetical protein
MLLLLDSYFLFLYRMYYVLSVMTIAKRQTRILDESE